MEISPAFDAAHTAAEAVRSLNRLTLGATSAAVPGGELVGDICAVLGELRLLARRLPQGLGQLADLLERGQRDANLGVDNDDDPDVVLSDVVVALRGARRDAEALGRDLAAAHDAVARLFVAPCLVAADLEIDK
jgi:hypothetical protein